ncbi:hypothetical protein [Saccharibacillus sp. JS10]|uniref:hypothetical protein n=1 Tax=Saccharibacillus sp. JS10 TaxID=2950552 RepID=UPI00210D084D|nr:hypothetical protein [Saccharibacillus sp. JS10]MCQ4085260.1 hypothetical protein [Saccharibacillus sp. JS10]
MPQNVSRKTKNGGHFFFTLLLTVVLCLSPAILKDIDPIDLDEALDNYNSADIGVGLLPSGLSSVIWVPDEIPLQSDPMPPDPLFFQLHSFVWLIGWVVWLHLKRMLLMPLKFLSNYVHKNRFSLS